MTSVTATNGRSRAHQDFGLVIVTGPPGAGKTTVSRLLAERFERGVCLDGDAFWQFIRTGWIAPWEPASQRQNGTVIDAVSRAALTYVRDGYGVVVDGIVSPSLLDRFVDEARRDEVELRYVVLRPDREVTRQRAVGRGAPWLTETGPIDVLYELFSSLGSYEQNVFDSSDLSAEETERLLWSDLESGRFTLP